MKAQRFVAAIGVAVVLSSICVGTAVSGGGTIASAAQLPFGQQVFANTDEVPPSGNEGCYKWDWYAAKLIAGDHLTILFENASSSAGTAGVQLFQKGTTDFNVNIENNGYYDDSIASADIKSNNHGEFDFDAPSTASYPLAFWTYNGPCDSSPPQPGAFDFTATTVHAERLSMNVTALGPHGSVAVSAHYPDGTAISSGLGATLYGFYYGSWNKLGQGAVSNGTIRISYTTPKTLRGATIKIEAKAGGPSFRAAVVTDKSVYIQ